MSVYLRTIFIVFSEEVAETAVISPGNILKYLYLWARNKCKSMNSKLKPSESLLFCLVCGPSGVAKRDRFSFRARR
jgi:hypothetical protein